METETTIVGNIIEISADSVLDVGTSMHACTVTELGMDLSAATNVINRERAEINAMRNLIRTGKVTTTIRTGAKTTNKLISWLNCR